MQPPGRTRRPYTDPLLKVGVAAMALALLCVAGVSAYALLRGTPEAAKAGPAVKALAYAPLVRSDPGVEPWVEEDVPPPRMEREPEPEPEPVADAPPEPRSDPEPRPDPAPEPKPLPEPEAAPEARADLAPERSAGAGSGEPTGSLPVEETDWPQPTEEQVESAQSPRHYDQPGGAVLGLTIGSIGLYNVPVLRSNTQDDLDNGVIHARGTSMPWSDTPERNVYLAGHRLGWPGTGSHLVFYRLDELGEGDQISLKSRDGSRYVYRVSDAFVVDPDDTWVMGRIRGRDMLTLQTCTPIPGFGRRLIVRAERV